MIAASRVKTLDPSHFLTVVRILETAFRKTGREERKERGGEMVGKGKKRGSKEIEKDKKNHNRLH